MNVNEYNKFISLLRLPQVKQGTSYWLQKRHDIISASIGGVVLGLKGPSAYHNLLQNKVSRDSSFYGSFATHWGNRYETAVDQVYEYIHNKKVYELGLVIHPKYDFIGASTDGITEDLINIEIKSPVSRNLDHLPSEYWVQMQLQMEVLDLYLSHFVEVKFLEKNIDLFDYKSVFFKPNLKDRNHGLPVNVTDDPPWGIIIEYVCLDCENPEYIYSPVKPCINWLKYQLLTFECEKNRIFLRAVRWDVDQYKKTEVVRDTKWFKCSLPIFKHFHDLIECYRELGVQRLNHNINQIKNANKPKKIPLKKQEKNQEKNQNNDDQLSECMC